MGTINIDTLNKSEMPFGTLSQIGIIVKDMNKAMEFLKSIGFGPFIPRFREPCDEVREGEKRVDINLELMFTYFNNLELELIQPKGEGLHMDFLRSTGGGIHHLGFWVDDLDAALTNLKEQGVKIKQIGRRSKAGGGFALLDARDDCGLIIEIAQGPVRPGKTK
ncbi:MAG: VOC family protein [Deltaproteobacteria bacterium]|nr:VOC family protein [Deltaproteobacteria bacterium]